MQIITSWKFRPLVEFAQLPKRMQKEFDYIDESDHWTPRFIHYRGAWHDTHDTQRIEPDTGRAHCMGWAMRVHPGSPLALFDSVESDTYFSGSLFRFGPDETVMCGRYFC
jgi:hypothetical protein